MSMAPKAPVESMANVQRAPPVGARGTRGRIQIVADSIARRVGKAEDGAPRWQSEGGKAGQAKERDVSMQAYDRRCLNTGRAY